MIDADGSQLGILSSKEAFKIAMDKNLDLVKIAPQAVPPVCRIMDYGKYRFEQAKREKRPEKTRKPLKSKKCACRSKLIHMTLTQKQIMR